MRLQLARARDTRRIITAALLMLGLLSQGVAVGKTKKAAAKKAVQPEKVYLEEEEDEEEPRPASQHEQGSQSTSTDAAESDVSDREKPAKAKPRSARVHASLETTGYTDTDAVNVLSPTVSVGAADEVAGWSFGGSYLVDVVTAASVDIVSTASPSWTEVRHVGAVNGSAKWDPVTLGAVGVVSREPDYLSITGGGSLSIDLMEKNVTPYFAFSFEKDSVGRTELPHEYWKDKQVTNFQVGLTVVLGRASIGSIQWDGSFERGYLAKPYRYVPLFAPGHGASIPAGASIDEVNRLRLSLRAIEQLPGSRDRHAVSGHLAHRFDRSTLRLDQRLYTDNWKLLASTSEVRYILDIGNRLQLWPHLRYHVQSAVSFWKRAYEAVPGPGGLIAPTLRTGDRELGPLQTIVLGAGTRWTLADGPSSRWDLVLEADVGHTTYSDTLYITERNMGYTTLAFEAEF